MSKLKVAALTIERRAVALAHFFNAHLDDIVIRHLPADTARAVSTVTAVINQISDVSSIPYMALASLPASASDRHRRVHETAVGLLRSKGIPYTEVSDAELYGAYGYPAVRSRSQLRRTGRAIWPVLNSPKIPRAGIDGALLGLYVQVERLFQLHEVQP